MAIKPVHSITTRSHLIAIYSDVVVAALFIALTQPMQRSGTETVDGLSRRRMGGDEYGHPENKTTKRVSIKKEIHNNGIGPKALKFFVEQGYLSQAL